MEIEQVLLCPTLIQCVHWLTGNYSVQVGCGSMRIREFGTNFSVRGADITRSAWLTAGSALQRRIIEIALEGSRPCELPLAEVSPFLVRQGQRAGGATEL